MAEAVLGSYGDAASSLACDLFDSVMEAEGVSVGAAQVYGGVREGAVEGYVRRVAGGIDGTQGSLDTFADLVGQLAEQETRRAASTTVEENVERAAKTRAGRKVRYARVPTSFVPCEWCAMLASRGFVYRSAESADAASHHHCTCTIVPGVKGSTEVAGYDTAHYKDVWKHRERYEKPQMVAELDLRSDGLIRQEGGASEGDLPKGSMDAMVSFADEFNARYPALRDAEGTYPMGLSSLTVCTTEDIMAEGGISADEARNALGMFMKAKDGSFNAGIYMNADLLSSATLEEVVSDFRHEYGHYVGWFIERNGAGSVEEMVRDVLDELAWDTANETRNLTAALIIDDLSEYAGKCWIEGLSGEVFAEAFRVWQEGGESRIAAILGPMIDAALKGVA